MKNLIIFEVRYYVLMLVLSYFGVHYVSLVNAPHLQLREGVKITVAHVKHPIYK